MDDDTDQSDGDAAGPVDSGPADVPSRAVLELDHVYEALGHPRRRYLCYTLLESTEWSLTDLATKIAAWENDVPEGAVTEDQRERVYVSLYHAHVPKLADERVVAFDDASETITFAENAEQVLTALQGMGASLDANQEAHARGEMDEGAQ
ncbi:hypothetical protein [Halogeometricum sp. CBA1124]|uniref:DUF7344 domain-containing protein n=1 Tax=Halogeometricum sp. CBA1124 TaxID=2668071 RepID=UPI00142A5A6D|nr:hypothetical protein [Halogeometricum sp. CBA1124]MUV58028.1 hypothetical protein [Halogeometricum sp. CBA1124]